MGKGYRPKGHHTPYAFIGKTLAEVLEEKHREALRRSRAPATDYGLTTREVISEGEGETYLAFTTDRARYNLGDGCRRVMPKRSLF